MRKLLFVTRKILSICALVNSTEFDGLRTTGILVKNNFCHTVFAHAQFRYIWDHLQHVVRHAIEVLISN